MQNLNIELLNQNIANLMQQTNTTQAKLADAIGMSQSNVSRNLSNRDGQRFTLEQVYKISQYFKISIDQLIGNNTTGTTTHSPRTIAKFISECIENGAAKITPVTITEEVFEIKYKSYDYPETIHENREIQYPAIYFPNYWDVWKGNNDEEIQCNLSEASQIGNETINISINDFIKKFDQIHQIFSHGELAEETYNMVVKDYLNRLRDR